MKRLGSRFGSRWRSALIVALLSAAILMVGVLAMQAGYAYRVHREAAESVLRDYAQVVADEFIRRTSVEIGYRGYHATLTALQQQLGNSTAPALPNPEDLAEHDLVRSLFLLDTKGSLSETGVPLDDEWRDRLEASIKNSGAMSGTGAATFYVLHEQGDDGQRTFIFAALARPAGQATLAAGFEVDFDAMVSRLQRVVDSGPLLPASLGDGKLSNELLAIRLSDAEGHEVYASGGYNDPTLTTYTPFGDTYSGMFKGLTLQTSIDPNAAPRLVIGGLPRSRLPVLTGLLLMTVGLLLAAIDQLRRERALARMRSDFVSRVSHELRTPLTQIRMFAETLLLGRDRSEDERRRSLEIVDQEARRLGHLVENILQFSRGDRDAIRLAPQPLALAPLLRSVVEKFMPVARARKVEIVATLDDSVVCDVDADAITQVLLNLLDNAVKYGPEGQEVHLGLEVTDSHGRIVVEDEGPGVPQRERRRIWKRWQRLERDERSAVAGTGIGLTVVRDLIGLHGGTVQVEDGSRGGARFVVELPRSRTR